MNRKMLKDNAKKALQHNFLLVLLVVLIAGFFGVSDLNISYSSNINLEGIFEDTDFDEDDIQTFKEIDKNEQIESMLGASIVILTITVIIFVISFIIATFISNPVLIGYRKFFQNNRLGQGEFSDLFSAFSSNYLNIVKVMFGTNIRIFGWSLLFIIPGIIKSYEYFFVPFILAENPQISGEQARSMSSQMTNGHKWDIFILGLSFIGWILLAGIVAIPLMILTCCCLGFGAYLVYLPLSAYISATYAELYQERKEYMLYISQ